MARLLVLLFIALPVHAELTRWFTGNPEDAHPRRLHGPVLMLVGGGGVSWSSALPAPTATTRTSRPWTA